MLAHDVCNHTVRGNNFLDVQVFNNGGHDRSCPTIFLAFTSGNPSISTFKAEDAVEFVILYHRLIVTADGRQRQRSLRGNCVVDWGINDAAYSSGIGVIVVNSLDLRWHYLPPGRLAC